MIGVVQFYCMSENKLYNMHGTYRTSKLEQDDARNKILCVELWPVLAPSPDYKAAEEHRGLLIKNNSDSWRIKDQLDVTCYFI